MGKLTQGHLCRKPRLGHQGSGAHKKIRELRYSTCYCFSIGPTTKGEAVDNDGIMTWEEIIEAFCLMVQGKKSPSDYTPAELKAMGSPTYVSPEGFITWE